MKKDFLSITDFTAKEILQVLSLAKELKEKQIQSGTTQESLKNKTLAMIFEKPSLRTKLSFSIAMTQLGGHAIYLGPQDIGMGSRESIADVAKVTSSMADIIMARTCEHKTIEELAKYSKVPVINGLSDTEHPCQILADLVTIIELKGKLAGLKIVFIGDGENNVAHSLCLASAMFGIHFTCASPAGFTMQSAVVQQAKEISKKTGSKIIQTQNPKEAAADADIVYTDTWVSMGDETEKEKRLQIFEPYQVNQELMNLAKPTAIFMHDLPAYRGNEVTAHVIDGPQSVVFQQAENRLHAQKALILNLLHV